MAFQRKQTAVDLVVRRRIEEFARELSAGLGELDESAGTCWFDAIERQATAIGDAVTVALAAQRSAGRPAIAHEAECPECGRAGRCQGDRERALITCRGATTIREPRYFCPCCRKDFFPAE